MRYARQEQLPEVPEGFHKTAAAQTLLLVGCGGVGSVLGEQLLRGGFRNLILVDSDLVDMTNLQRQLFTEADLGTPKVTAMQRRLESIDSEATITSYIDAVSDETIHAYASQADLIIDATDNFTTRQVINRWTEEHGKDWLYTGAIAHKSAVCLFEGKRKGFHRVFPQEPEEARCCDVGVLVSSCFITASLAYVEVLNYFITGPSRRFLQCNAWTGRMDEVHI